MLLASWPVAVCQLESVDRTVELKIPTAPPVPVA